MLLSNSEEENFEVNKFSDERFVDVHEAKNEKFEKLAESDIKSECELGKDPLYVSENKTINKRHERKKRFRCNTCYASFARKVNLTQHIESVHEEKKAYNCLICNKAFSRKTNLSVHCKEVH